MAQSWLVQGKVVSSQLWAGRKDITQAASKQFEVLYLHWAASVIQLAPSLVPGESSHHLQLQWTLRVQSYRQATSHRSHGGESVLK